LSFILDALRKSDAERQRAATPGLADVRYARPETSRRNLWLPVLVLVLAANAVFLGIQWFGQEPAPVAPAPVTPMPEPAAVAPAADVIRPLAREAELPGTDVEAEFGPAPVTGPELVPAPVVVEAAEPDPPAPMADAVAPAPAPAAAAAAAPATPSRIVPGDDLPTAEELMARGGLNVPLLNLDLHVYSDAPAGRFVVINSRKYKEGAQTAEGPTVDTITADGVILSNQGRRFTLSRR